VLSDINVTPIVDVMLVLVIIFIITVPVALKEINGTFAEGQNLPTRPSRRCHVAVGHIRSHLLENKDVRDRMRFGRDAERCANQTPKPKSHIRGDSESRTCSGPGLVAIRDQES